ncbi:16S rRNA (cytidine(1402)-2'-O)-methyltransferase [Marinicella sp. S1101]|uniref:16S rRNA (cytidine(1402)-2'-O)-methyltransferase n=1 Tax=Marinicella marina TaxID=2996016 RepID=UPI00226103C3|nr:16S rRNA (cytidine(1402)-2'-O)-methyltransferase [Marinicella marina]MCX7552651.1 16S rRNA (cytidine(1402)-2'-O)-methyltransferase [Marinicella marina]MDJ1139527.1 16S rRNA (cytidine(1402)-2'-O)-methyltransferase [Marinicella marina]
MNQSSATASGTLYVVATPIGNLNDITLRALEVLNQCDLVACEDTRHSMRLFQAHGITTKTVALHQHNEAKQSHKLIERLINGDDVALVSDAGTPLISDPGFPLLGLAHENNIKVVPIPGPSALIALLSVAAINTQPFVFHGFVPPKSKQRVAEFVSWLETTATHVYYESSHRIVASIEALIEVFGETAEVAMGRELTKTFEQIFTGTAIELLQLVESNNNHQKGEFVLAVLNKKPAVSDEIGSQPAALIAQLMPLLPPKTVAKVVADHYGLNKKQVYNFILRQATT